MSPRIGMPGLDDVESGFDPIPSARYTVQVLAFSEKKAKDGSDYLGMELEVKLPEEIREVKTIGRKLFTNLSLKEQAKWKVKEFLAASGTPWDENGWSTEDAIGQFLDVDVRMTVYCRECNKRFAYKGDLGTEEQVCPKCDQPGEVGNEVKKFLPQSREVAV